MSHTCEGFGTVTGSGAGTDGGGFAGPTVSSTVCSDIARPCSYFPLTALFLFSLCLPLLLFRSFLDDGGEG